jgi:hypothetical protein
MAIGARAHAWQHALGQVHRCEQVDVDHFAPVGWIGRFDAAGPDDAGAIDQDINATVLR